MRTTMQRRITQTEIKIVGMNVVEGTVHSEFLESVIVTGKINRSKAEKLANEQYGHLYATVAVMGLEESEQLYEMEIDTFVEHATPVQE